MSVEIGVLGGGAFGTALSDAFAQNGHGVRMWARDPNTVLEINRHHINTRYTGQRSLAPSIVATTNLADLMGSKVALLVYACPSKAFRSITSELASSGPRGFWDRAFYVNAAKGIENQSLELHHEIAQDVFGKSFVLDHYMALSGPSFATEILDRHPTCLTLAGMNPKSLEKTQALLASPRFRLFTNTDLIGCQLGGAVKNVIAIATGMVAGLGLGFNTQAALINLGLAEIARLGRALGARVETFLGLSGMGDLILTCTSELSRNRSFGLLLGQGLSTSVALSTVGSTVEGFEAATAVYKLAKKTKTRAPICTEIYRVLHENKSANKALERLLAMPQSDEWA